jgi:hypothetical protein
MLRTATAALMGLSLSVIAFGGAHAQDGAMKPADGRMMMSGKAMDRKMSDEDNKTVKMCKGMGHDAMMKNDRCKEMMKTHPDAMKTDSGMMMMKK